ncbi:hypothetical protein INT47_012854 [Mucor saturninus]|uniref:ATP-binding cassette sub-family B member 6 n=1 Tax=Mucor saturninus TaxID=64648 RepID=A0A8H7V1B0_9FUNG|nr:hypothetical protein INT47_012854 [Mucor saturninus]
MNKADVFPPYYSSDEFVWTTPFVIGPSILLGTLALVGLPRYLHNRFHQTSATTTRPLSTFSKFIVLLAVIITSSFLVDALVIVARVIVDDHWTSSVLAYYIIVSWLAWTLSLAALADETQKFSQWFWVQYLFWIIAVLNDTFVGWLWMMGVLKPVPGTIFSAWDHVLLGIFITRYIVEVLVLMLSIGHLFNNPPSANDGERSALLSSTAQQYGTRETQPTTSTKTPTSEPSPFEGFFYKMKKLLPFIWPHHDYKLQLYVVLCFVLMSLGFAVNLLAPQQIGYIVDNLKAGEFAWMPIMIYVGLKFLQGGSGLLQSLQNWLWIPIGQYTTREISLKTFSHLHSLSLGFHINRKTGEVLRIMDRGTSSVVNLLNQILFQIFPVWVNIALISVYATYIYAPSFGLIVFMTMVMYMYVTIAVTEWRTKYRRRMIELDNYARTKAVDSLLNFETVKYYNAENFEINRYKDAILDYQEADWKSSVSLNILNLAQNAIITGGLLSGCLLFAYEVSKGELTAGNFVAFNMYMMQLYTPLHWFGTYYRMIQSNFIDMEKMFALLDEVETVQDAPDATEMVVSKGHVVFDNVTFSYDGRQTALDGISFTIPKGATVALVGPSGGGKSTILRLLFRFYDPSSGSISIDDQNIRQVTQLSLRKNIGVVPQDTVLFNDSIFYNIQYGDVLADESDIYRAAKAAMIHDKIESFPDGYETKVGERGLRLSGGEKQRVAIARTILKNPPIILLDEATSALDTTTERHIQQALADMTKDRTTLVVAHRLSTIVNADLILVIKDGKVVESGSHEELIKKGSATDEGVYYEMWQKQLFDESETQSETAMEEETGSTCTLDDLKKKKPTPIETLVLDEVEDEGSNKDNVVSSPIQVETIDLEEESTPPAVEEEESIPPVVEEEETTTPAAEETTTTSDDGNNKQNTASSNSLSNNNNSKKNKKKKKRSKSKF